jgi:hypothetical protein
VLTISSGIALGQTLVVLSLARRSKLRVSWEHIDQVMVSSLSSVTVLLQAMKQEPPMDMKCRDKFLVQSVAVTADKEFANIGSIVGPTPKHDFYLC